MKVEERLKSLEDELRLMRSQVRQTLSDVRDFLQNLEMPPPRRSEPPEIEDLEDSAKPAGVPGPEPVPEEAKPTQLGQEGSATGTEPTPGERQAPVSGPPGKTLSCESELAGEHTPGQCSKLPVSEMVKETEKPIPLTPQVNLLANLVRWVSVARREIGDEQLPTFLDVYRIAGQLSSEIREVILQLAEVMAQHQTEQSTADVWSWLLLELHGILSGGGTPLRLLKQRREQADKPQERAEQGQPVKLKLVLPVGEEGEREFSLTLTPEDSRKMQPLGIKVE